MVGALAHRTAARWNASSAFGTFNHSGAHMNLHLSITPLISLLAGILILVMPKLLNFIVAIYLIVIGLIGLLGSGRL
jgi:hypothetical protein